MLLRQFAEGYDSRGCHSTAEDLQIKDIWRGIMMKQGLRGHSGSNFGGFMFTVFIFHGRYEFLVEM